MNDKSENKLPVSVEIGAKATLEIKTEIPKESTGRLVDALTDIIRPFSEARGLKADLLRLQREEVAIEIARKAREKLAIEGTTPQPVSNKILVPLMEKGSCEDVTDSSMIDKWANLLASASLNLPVQPRFVGILGELAGSQAECLEYIAFNNSEKWEFPAREFANSFLEFAEHNFVPEFQNNVRDVIKRQKNPNKNLDEIVDGFAHPGVFLELLVIADSDEGIWLEYDSVAETGTRRESDLSVLESLGLIRRVVSSFEAEIKVKKKSNVEVSVFYYHLTQLGFEFCEVCARPRVRELEEIDHESARKKGLIEL
jgi:Abortive infection alpha